MRAPPGEAKDEIWHGRARRASGTLPILVDNYVGTLLVGKKVPFLPLACPFLFAKRSEYSSPPLVQGAKRGLHEQLHTNTSKQERRTRGRERGRRLCAKYYYYYYSLLYYHYDDPLNTQFRSNLDEERKKEERGQKMATSIQPTGPKALHSFSFEMRRKLNFDFDGTICLSQGEDREQTR